MAEENRNFSMPSHYSVHETLQALRQAQAEHPKLRELLRMHEDLLVVQAEIGEKGEGSDRAFPLDTARVRRLYDAGVPWLLFEDLQLVPEDLAGLVQRLSAVLRAHRTEWASAHLEADPGTLMGLAEQAVSGHASLISDGSNLTEVATELAVEAHMRALAERVVPQLDLSQWRRGPCPFCGSAATLAVIEPTIGARYLFCNRCYTSWSFPRIGCPFCSNDTSLTYHETDQPAYRLSVCPVCQKYIKTLDLRKSPLPANPAVHDLLTVGLDVVALQHGYDRAD